MPGAAGLSFAGVERWSLYVGLEGQTHSNVVM